MSEEDQEKTKETLDEELSRIKSEMAEIKDLLKSQKSENEDEEMVIDATGNRKGKSSKNIHGPGGFNLNIDFDDDLDFDVDVDFDSDEFNNTMNEYMNSVRDGINKNLRNSLNQMMTGFAIFDNQTREKLRRTKHELKQRAKEVEHEIKRASRDRYRGSSSIRFQKLSEEELERFYEIGPNLMNALGDTRRLTILKSLENGPKYQGDLSDATDVKGGTLKHHLDTLIASKLVYQEQTRGRYLITQLGMEALKLAEMIFRRFEAEVKKESDKTQEYQTEIEVEDVENEVKLTENSENSDEESENQSEEEEY